jgi:hypothetical protein
MSQLTWRPIAWLLTAGAFACSSGSTAPEGMGRVAFQIATTGTGSSNGPAAADVVVSRGGNVIAIEQVQLVARKIRLSRFDAACVEAEDDDDAPVASSAAGQAHDSDDGEAEDDDEDCPVLKLGPLLLEPPLNDGAETSFTAFVPVGTYTRLQLQIHKPRGSKDLAFLAAHADFADVSIRVKGTFNGAPFTFDTDLTEEEHVVLPTPVEVTAEGTTAFTLLLDVRGWFLDQSGTALLSPIAPSDAIRQLIEHNISSSFHAFRDDDHDGDDDDHDGH